jgi:hypothetical protein
MYPSYNQEARNYLFAFLKCYFPDADGMVHPKIPIKVENLEKYAQSFSGNSYNDDYKILNRIIREHKENIPPLVNAYMNLSPTMRTFGVALNSTFGKVEEIGIMITIDDVYEKKKARHINILGRKILLSKRKKKTEE